MVEDARRGFRILETSDVRLGERKAAKWKADLCYDEWVLQRERLEQPGQSAAGFK